MKLSLILLFSIPLVAFSQRLDFNENCEQAYHHIIAYQLEDGQKFINKESIKNADNAILSYLQNYLDFLRIFISEDPYIYQKSLDQKEDRIEMIANVSNEETPYYFYCQGEVHLQWAFIHLKFGDYFKAALSLYKANQFLQKTKEKYPTFIPVNKSLGLIHSIVGTIPDQYQWMIEMVGFSGTIEEGTQELYHVVNDTSQGNIFQEEASIIYVFALLYLKNDSQEAWKAVSELHKKYSHNLILRYSAAQVAIHNGQSNRAIELLEAYPKEKYADFPYLDFMLGSSKLNQLNPQCEEHFKRFIESYKGKQYIKEAYLKLSWNALIQNDTTNYHYYRTLCLERGSLDNESDEQAQTLSTSEIIPNDILLKARLIFDGGNFLLSKTVLKKYKDKENLEYNYRLARIYQKLKMHEEATLTFKKIISSDQKEDGYFVANSLLQLGYINELENNFELAKFYFDLCLKMEDFLFQNSIHQKAKAGKNRIKA